MSKARRTVNIDDLEPMEAAKYVLDNAKRLAELAEEKEDLRTSLMALREFGRATELYAKLTGEIGHGNQLLADQRWIQLRQVIVTALQPYPEAQQAVLQAIAGATTRQLT